MKQANNKPPRAALAFFRWYCNSAFLEEIEGDLTERFYYHSEKFGPGTAKWLFTKDVLLMFRPTIIGNIFRLTHKSTIMTTHSKRLLFILASIPALLLIPLIAMQFSKAVDWNFPDFLIMGCLLLGTGLLCEFVLRKVKSTKGRFILCGAVLLSFLLVWAELAVGIL